MLGKAKALKAKVTDKVGTALAAPKVAYHNSLSKKYNREFKTLRHARDTKHLPATVKNGVPNDIAAVRSEADSIRSARNKKYGS